MRQWAEHCAIIISVVYWQRWTVNGWYINSSTYRRISLRLIVRAHEIRGRPVLGPVLQRIRKKSATLQHEYVVRYFRYRRDIADLLQDHIRARGRRCAAETRQPGTPLRRCKMRLSLYLFLSLFFFFTLFFVLSLQLSLPL